MKETLCALFDRLADLVRPGLVAPNKEHDSVVSVRGSQKVILVPQVRDVPKRKCGTVCLYDVGSFVAYVCEHKEASTRIFLKADKSAVLATAIIDYHGTEMGDPRWGQHRARISLGLDPELAAWVRLEGTRLSQIDFSEFIQDHARAVSEPAAASLIEMALNLEGSTDSLFEAVQDPHTGNKALRFKEDTKATSTVDIPREIVLVTPVFDTSEPVEVKIALAFRINQGVPVFFFRIPAMEAICRVAAVRLREQVAKATGLPVFVADAPEPVKEVTEPIVISKPEYGPASVYPR